MTDRPAWLRRASLRRAWPDADQAANRQGFLFDALVIIIAWALVSRTFLTGNGFIPWDSADEFFPQARFVVDAIRSGQAPWWNPYLYGGQPVLGDPQGLIFTPHVLVGLIVGEHFNLYIYDMTSLVTVLCGGIALARYTRAYADSRTLPILGALVFIAGGVATSRLQHVTQIVSYGLLPLQLLALRAVCLRPNILRTALCTLLLAAGVLNPNQVVFLSAFALLPFVVWHISQSPYRLRAVVALAVAGCVVVAASLPTLSAIGEFISLSNRSSMDMAESADSSFPLFSIASILLPGLYGAQSPQNGYWPPTDFSQDFLYIGLLPVGMVLWSLCSIRRPSVILMLCWLGIGASFIYAMGTRTPAYPFLFHHVPGFSAFRRPADAAFFLNMFIALLIGSSRFPARARIGPWPVVTIVVMLLLMLLGTALTQLALYAEHVGHGADLMRVLHVFAVRLVIAVLAGLAIAALSPRIACWAIAPMVIGLTVWDLSHGLRSTAFVGSPLITEISQTYGGTLSWAKPRNPVEETISFLRQNGVMGDNPAWRIEAIGGPLSADMPMAFGILTTQGYDPLKLRSYDEAVGAQVLQGDVKRFTAIAPGYDSPDYRRLGLRYVLIHSYIADHTGDFGEFGAAVADIRKKFMTGGWAQRLSVPGLYEIWELHNAMPRANVVAVDGTQTACDVVTFRTVSVTIRCHAPAAGGELVLGDNFAPGWRACVNGIAVAVQPFEGIFRSVPVPQGDSLTEFQYQPIPFLRGAPSCGSP
jgi:hypothetical protein